MLLLFLLSFRPPIHTSGGRRGARCGHRKCEGRKEEKELCGEQSCGRWRFPSESEQSFGGRRRRGGSRDGNEEETERNRPQPGSLTEGVETKTDQVFCIPLCTLCFLLFFSIGLIVEVDFLKELVAFPHCNLFFSWSMPSPPIPHSCFPSPPSPANFHATTAR